MQRLPGDRSWTVHAVRSGEHDNPQRRKKAKLSIIFCIGDRKKLKKSPANTTCMLPHCTSDQSRATRATKSNFSNNEALGMETSSTNNTLVFLIRSLALSFVSTWPVRKAAAAKHSVNRLGIDRTRGVVCCGHNGVSLGNVHWKATNILDRLGVRHSGKGDQHLPPV